jgi:hypothetical protein
MTLPERYASRLAEATIGESATDAFVYAPGYLSGGEADLVSRQGSSTLRMRQLLYSRTCDIPRRTML